MSKFHIQPHGRLQEWVAEEKGYFRDEGLDYEFVNSYVAGESGYAAVQSTESAAPEVKRRAFENMERGRAADVSCACHWAVNMASSSGHGRMWGHAYSVTPSAIVVPPESTIKKPSDLANVEVGVGYRFWQLLFSDPGDGKSAQASRAEIALYRTAQGSARGIARSQDRCGKPLGLTLVSGRAAGFPPGPGYHLHDRLSVAPRCRSRRCKALL